MPKVILPTLHAGQVEAFRLREDARGGPWAANTGRNRIAIRCGRRWGKTKYGACRASDRALKGKAYGWFAPDYKKLSEAYQDIRNILRPITASASKIDGVIRTINGGRVDFWTLNDPDAGRSRFYHEVFIDEGAFTKNGPLDEPESMLSIWEKAIEPTLFDYQGTAIVASNTSGADPENFLYAICNDPKWGFIEYHAPTISNPLLPMRKPGETDEEHWARRKAAIEAIRASKHPLVFRQEYEAEFVDWSGVAFFALDKMLVAGSAVPLPPIVDYVFAVVDSATKTGAGNDGTAVTYFALTTIPGLGHPLVVLDWDIVQIEGDLLEAWLPTVIQNLDEWTRRIRCRMGSRGVWIEDANSGSVLIQKFRRQGAPVQPIPETLKAMGKDERALSVSGYHYNGKIKLSQEAHDKVTTYKGTTRNHFVSQVTSFRIGDKDAAKRADDLLDTYTYGAALALGDGRGN